LEIKCQLDATEVFIADLIACSTCFGRHYAHHQELKSIIQWLHVEQAVRSAIKTSVASSWHFISTYQLQWITAGFLMLGVSDEVCF